MRPDIETCTDIEVLRREAYRLTSVIDVIVDTNEFKDKRIKDLEEAIHTSTIIGWRVDELPDDKHMMVLTIVDKVRDNLKKVYPLKILEDMVLDE